MIQQTASAVASRYFYVENSGGDPRRWITVASCKQSPPPSPSPGKTKRRHIKEMVMSSPFPPPSSLSLPPKFSRSWNITIALFFSSNFYQSECRLLRGGRLLARLVVNVCTLSLEGSLRKGILIVKFSIHSNRWKVASSWWKFQGSIC